MSKFIRLPLPLFALLGLLVLAGCVSASPTAAPVAPTLPPTAPPAPTDTPVPTPTATPAPTLVFIPTRVPGIGGMFVTGTLGNWALAEGPLLDTGADLRSVRNVADDAQQYSCIYYPDSRGAVPRVNLFFPYPLQIDGGVSQRAVKSVTSVGDLRFRSMWQTWETRHDRLILRGRRAQTLLQAITDQRVNEFTVTLTDNPELSKDYSTVGLLQMLAVSEMSPCFGL